MNQSRPKPILSELDTDLIQESLNSLNQGVGIFDAEHRLVSSNRKFSEFLKLPDELAAAGPRFEDVAKITTGSRGSDSHGAGADFSLRLERAKKGEQNLFVFTRHDGAIIEVLDTPLPAGGIVITCTDITEHKIHEGNLAESANQVDAILEHAVEGILTIGEDGIIQTINPAAVKMFGYTADEVIGENVAILMPESDGKKDRGYLHDGFLQAYIETGHAKILGIGPREVTARRKDGELITVELNVSEFYFGTSRRFIGSMRDITKRKETEEAHKAIEENFRNLFEGSLQGIFIHDGYEPLFINDALVKMFGYDTADEIFALRSMDLLYAPEERDRLNSYRDARLRGEEAPEIYEFGGLRKDGSKIWLQRASRAVTWQGRRAIQGTMIDITERHQAEEALKASEENLKKQVAELMDKEERLEAQGLELVTLAEDAAIMRDQLKKLNQQKDKFFSIIAHDLKSPFNALIGFSGILESRGHDLDKEKVVEYGQLIHQASEQAYALLEDLLEWSRMQMGRMEYDPQTINISRTVEAGLTLFEPSAQAKNISITSDHDPNLTAYADRIMVETILRNLLNNAIKFTDEGGCIALMAKQTGDWVEVSVSDNGVGMTPEKAERLFHLEVKTTTKGTGGETGTGLGLHLCKDLIEVNGGEITIDSTLGVGSTFSFTLPVNKKNLEIQPKF